MGKLVLMIIGLVLAVFGTIFIYDARSLTKKLFSFGDQNEATSGMKILGFILCIVGGLIVYFNM